LIHVLPQWSLAPGSIHAVYPATRFRPANVKAFVAMLVARENRSNQQG
jgi:DNA-binding transcriptional LysR family regulator